MLIGGLNKPASFSFLLKRLPALGGQFEQVNCDEFTGNKGSILLEIITRVFSENYFDFFFLFILVISPQK